MQRKGPFLARNIMLFIVYIGKSTFVTKSSELVKLRILATFGDIELHIIGSNLGC